MTDHIPKTPMSAPSRAFPSIDDVNKRLRAENPAPKVALGPIKGATEAAIADDAAWMTQFAQKVADETAQQRSAAKTISEATRPVVIKVRKSDRNRVDSWFTTKPMALGREAFMAQLARTVESCIAESGSAEKAGVHVEVHRGALHVHVAIAPATHFAAAALTAVAATNVAPRRPPNTPEGHEALAAWLPRFGEHGSVIEACFAHAESFVDKHEFMAFGCPRETFVGVREGTCFLPFHTVASMSAVLVNVAAWRYSGISADAKAALPSLDALAKAAQYLRRYDGVAPGDS